MKLQIDIYITKKKLFHKFGDVTCGIRAIFQTLGMIGSLAYKQETKYTNHILNLFLYRYINFVLQENGKR